MRLRVTLLAVTLCLLLVGSSIASEVPGLTGISDAAGTHGIVRLPSIFEVCKFTEARLPRESDAVVFTSPNSHLAGRNISALWSDFSSTNGQSMLVDAVKHGPIDGEGALDHATSVAGWLWVRRSANDANSSVVANMFGGAPFPFFSPRLLEA